MRAGPIDDILDLASRIEVDGIILCRTLWCRRALGPEVEVILWSWVRDLVALGRLYLHNVVERVFAQ